MAENAPVEIKTPKKIIVPATFECIISIFVISGYGRPTKYIAYKKPTIMIVVPDIMAKK
jgi:hypothetical protein